MPNAISVPIWSKVGYSLGRRLLEEALVVAHHQLRVDLLHGFEGHTDRDQDRDAAEGDLTDVALSRAPWPG